MVNSMWSEAQVCADSPQTQVFRGERQHCLTLTSFTQPLQPPARQQSCLPRAHKPHWLSQGTRHPELSLCGSAWGQHVAPCSSVCWCDLQKLSFSVLWRCLCRADGPLLWLLFYLCVGFSPTSLVWHPGMACWDWLWWHAVTVWGLFFVALADGRVRPLLPCLGLRPACPCEEWVASSPRQKKKKNYLRKLLE